MTQQHLPIGAFLIVAPAATAMLALDLKRRVATARFSSVSQAAHPVQYKLITGLNMLVVVFCWFEVAGVIAGWLARTR